MTTELIKGGDATKVIEVSISQLSEHSKQPEYSPQMTKKKWRGFIAGIAKEGILQPIIITKGFRVIDGKHRLKAARELGLESVRVIVEDIPESEIPAYITETKLNRDDLKSGQKAAIVIRLFYEEERQKAKDRQVLSGELYGIGKDSPNLDEPIKSERTDVALAKKAGIGKSSMAYLLSVYRNRPDLFERVFSGEYTINRAYTTMKDDEEPEEVVEEVETDFKDQVTSTVSEMETVAKQYEGLDESKDDLDPNNILRNRISQRIPQFAREFVHDYDILDEAESEIIEAYTEQIQSVAEGALLILQQFETDPKKKLLFEIVSKSFSLSKDEEKLNEFIKNMGGIINE